MNAPQDKLSEAGIEALLDSTLDDLEDLPEFKPFPAGVHRALATLELKVVNEVQCIELSLKGIETAELAEPTKDVPIKAGDTASALFMLNNEFGRGAFKAIAKPMAEALGTSTTRQLIDAAKGVEVLVITTAKKDKNDPDRVFMKIKELQVV